MGAALATGACGIFYDNGGRRDTGRPEPTASRAPAPPSSPADSAKPFEAVPPPGAPAIPIPADGAHRVERGNTVYSISRLYGVPVRAIITSNGLTPPYLLKVGDSLAIPGRRGHWVAKGETVYSISRQYGVPMSELTRANGIAQPFTIVIGQELAIPSASTTRVVVAIPQAAPGGSVEATPLPSSRPAAKATPKQIQALPKPPARGGSVFLWPVGGKVVSRFGSQQAGRHNDGINISAKRGTTVVAAENGVVAYAGNELRGFGNLLLIKHADGYMTAYAHNESLLVGRGAMVKKGQAIARVGSTGSVGAPQLHFEIRKGRKAVDPLRHLPRKSAGN